MSHRTGADAGIPLDPALSFDRLTFDNYHDVKHLMPTEIMSFSIECVCCRNKTETGEAHSLIPSHRDHLMATGPLYIRGSPAHQLHMPLILPCGHIVGWSCLSVERTGRCPACGVIWCRDLVLISGPSNGSVSPCHHPIGINPLRTVSAMTDDEAQWLVPPGGYMPERCRKCVTLDALKELTRLARGPMPREAVRCVYTTDGILNGLLEGDALRPFEALDIEVNPALIPQGLLGEARRREEAIRAQFDGRTPSAETGLVGAGRGMRFGIRVAGLTSPAGEEAVGGK